MLSKALTALDGVAIEAADAESQRRPPIVLDVVACIKDLYTKPDISSEGLRLKEPSTSGRYHEVDDTEGEAITLQASTTTRGGSLAAALLGVLAVLASLFLGPAATTAQAAAAPASTASIVRGVAPLYLRPRETRDHLRVLTRRGAGEHSRLAVATERTATAGQGPTLFTAVFGAAVLVPPLVVGFPAVRERSGQVSRHMWGTHRDRAPPALALT